MTSPSEAQFQQAVVDLALLRGWLVMHIHDSRRSTGNGWPDLFLLHPKTGQIVVAELKTSSGRVSHAQQDWIDAFAVAGITAHVWRPVHFTTGQIQRALTPTPLEAAS